MNADDSSWAESPEIAKIEHGVVTLFTPTAPNSSTAIENHVHCDGLEITEGAVGCLPVALRILRRYGAVCNLGEIGTWEEPVFVPTAIGFPKGGNVFF